MRERITLNEKKGRVSIIEKKQENRNKERITKIEKKGELRECESEKIQQTFIWLSQIKEKIPRVNQ